MLKRAGFLTIICWYCFNGHSPPRDGWDWMCKAVKNYHWNAFIMCMYSRNVFGVQCLESRTIRIPAWKMMIPVKYWVSITFSRGSRWLRNCQARLESSNTAVNDVLHLLTKGNQMLIFCKRFPVQGNAENCLSSTKLSAKHIKTSTRNFMSNPALRR